MKLNNPDKTSHWHSKTVISYGWLEVYDVKHFHHPQLKRYQQHKNFCTANLTACIQQKIFQINWNSEVTSEHSVFHQQ